MNLPTESWNRTQFRTQRRNWICPCVYVLQTTSQKEIYGRVRTGCKEKRAGRAKFVFFHLLIGLITVVVTSAFAQHSTVLVKAPAIFSLHMYVIQNSVHWWIASFLWKPTLGWREKKSVVLEKKFCKETTIAEWIKANCALKILIFRYFTFFLELIFYFVLFIHFISFLRTTFSGTLGLDSFRHFFLGQWPKIVKLCRPFSTLFIISLFKTN